MTDKFLNLEGEFLSTKGSKKILDETEKETDRTIKSFKDRF